MKYLSVREKFKASVELSTQLVLFVELTDSRQSQAFSKAVWDKPWSQTSEFPGPVPSFKDLRSGYREFEKQVPEKCKWQRENSITYYICGTSFS